MPIVFYLMYTKHDRKLILYPNKTEVMNTAIAQETEMKVLQSKIEELQSALFYTESASLIKLPTHVIPDVEIDEQGRIWFAIPRPMQHIDAFEKEVPAKL